MEVDELDPLPPRWPRTEEETVPEIATLAPEDEAWRLLQFRNLGIDEHQAILLAIEKADWHQAKDMADQGCPPHLIAEILL